MLARLFSGGPEVRAIQATAWGSWGDDTAGTTWAGKRVDTETALSLLTVMGCVRLISDQLSTLPLEVYRQQKGRKTVLPTPQWLIEPIVGLGYASWLTQITSSLLLAGNAYVAVTYQSNGNIGELIPLDPAKVRLERVKGQRVYFVGGAPFKGQILHIPALMLAGSEVGLSPVEYARQTIGLGLATQEHAARFFGQGAVLSGVIEVPGELQPGKAKEWARAWARAHSGNNKAHLPGVLEGGATWKPTAITNEQAQFLDTQKFTAVQIAGSMFGVDPIDLGLSNTGSSLTYANLEQRSTHRIQMTLMPWIVRIEKALSALLVRPQFVKLNVDELLRGDSSARYANYAMAAQINTAAAAAGQPPFLLTSEMRDFEDLDPLPDAPPPPVPTPDPAAVADPALQSAQQQSFEFNGSVPHETV